LFSFCISSPPFGKRTISQKAENSYRKERNIYREITIPNNADIIRNNIVDFVQQYGYNILDELQWRCSNMTIKEAAAAWGITERRVNALCKAGRISGAYKEGRQWVIPDGTQKPMDKRGHRSAVIPAVSSARKPLPIGVSDYRDACKNYYYVDKTLMIKEFLDERPKVSLFTRPRRFGKTLNMDMLRTFFEKTTEDTSVYFRDKKIWSCGGSYLAHHRKYPVIFCPLRMLNTPLGKKPIRRSKS